MVGVVVRVDFQRARQRAAACAGDLVNRAPGLRRPCREGLPRDVRRHPVRSARRKPRLAHGRRERRAHRSDALTAIRHDMRAGRSVRVARGGGRFRADADGEQESREMPVP